MKDCVNIQRVTDHTQNPYKSVKLIYLEFFPPEISRGIFGNHVKGL